MLLLAKQVWQVSRVRVSAMIAGGMLSLKRDPVKLREGDRVITRVITRVKRNVNNRVKRKVNNRVKRKVNQKVNYRAK